MRTTDELVSTDGGSRNLRTGDAKDVGDDIGIILCLVGELGKFELEVGGIVDIVRIFLDGVGLLTIDGTEAVEADRFVGTPLGELTGTGGGMRHSVGVVDIEVGTGNTGIDGHIVGIALTAVVEDIVEYMDIGRTLAGESHSVGLGGACIDSCRVVVDIDIATERVDVDASGDKRGGSGAIDSNHIIIEGDTVDIGATAVADNNTTFTTRALVGKSYEVALDAGLNTIGHIDTGEGFGINSDT